MPEDGEHWVDAALRDWNPEKMRAMSYEARNHKMAGFPDSNLGDSGQTGDSDMDSPFDFYAKPGMDGGMGSMGGGMGGMGGMGGLMESDEMKKIQNIAEWVTLVLKWGMYAFFAYLGYKVVSGAWQIGRTHGPAVARQVRRSASQKRRPFERAAMLALVSVCAPVVVAQLGLLAGARSAPALGWKLYLYGTFASGGLATVLAGVALGRRSESSKVRAAVCLVASVCVLVLWYAAAHTHSDRVTAALPPCNDVTTDVDEPPLFDALAADGHASGYPRALVGVMRAHYDELLAPKLTTLPIGAAFIRALHIAREARWKLITNLTYTDGTRDGSAGGYLEPKEWMDKDEVRFEATSTTKIFKIPDEVVVRVRHHTFDDGYVGCAQGRGALHARQRTPAAHAWQRTPGSARPAAHAQQRTPSSAQQLNGWSPWSPPRRAVLASTFALEGTSKTTVGRMRRACAHSSTTSTGEEMCVKRPVPPVCSPLRSRASYRTSQAPHKEPTCYEEPQNVRSRGVGLWACETRRHKTHKRHALYRVWSVAASLTALSARSAQCAMVTHPGCVRHQPLCLWLSESGIYRLCRGPATCDAGKKGSVA